MKHLLELNRRLYHVEGLDGRRNPDDLEYSENPEPCDDDEAIANLVGSTSTFSDRYHYPLFDVDANILSIVPSRSGHGQHLYVNKAVRWQDFCLLLRAMAICGICDTNWADACINEQVAVLRRPKSEAAAEPQPPIQPEPQLEMKSGSGGIVSMVRRLRP